MKGGPRSFAEQICARLLDLWRGEEEFGRPFGCVTTRFTFDAALFEEQCLARFLTIQSNPNETAKAYIVEREEKLSQCFTCVLVDRAHAAPDRSLRWNSFACEAAARRGAARETDTAGLGAPHPGFDWLSQPNRSGLSSKPRGDDRARFRAAGGTPPELLAQCVAFLNRVRTFAPGSNQRQSGPQAALAKFLKSVKRRVRSLPPAPSGEAECALVSLVPGGPTVVEQLRGLWKGPAPDNAWVVNSFYDVDRQAKDTAASVAGLLTTRGDRRLFIAAPGRKLPDGTVQIDVPKALKRSSHTSLKHLFSVVHQRVEIDGKEEEAASSREVGMVTNATSGHSTCSDRATSPQLASACIRDTTSN